MMFDQSFILPWRCAYFRVPPFHSKIAVGQHYGQVWKGI